MKGKKIVGLMLAGLTALGGGLLLSGCNNNNDNKNNTNQSQDINANKPVSFIDVYDSSVPNYVIKGFFNRSNIKLTVGYTDNTVGKINVTDNMFSDLDKAKLNIIGEQTVVINYKGKTANLTINVVSEGYLLKEVLTASTSRNCTIVNTFSSGDYEMKINYNSKVSYKKSTSQYSTSHNQEVYTWQTGDTVYRATKNGDADWFCGIYAQDQNIFDTNQLSLIPDVAINGGTDANGDVYECSFGINAEDNYTWTIAVKESGVTEVGFRRIYTFNDIELLEVKSTYDINTEYEYSADITCDYTSTLTVPDEVKALESTATVEEEM